MAGSVKLDSNMKGIVYKFKSRNAGLSRLMPSVAKALSTGVSDVFGAEGPGWEPLAPSTIKQRRGTSHKILQDNGDFARTIGTGSGADWAQAFGAVSYAQFHATGTKHMPKRNPFDFGPATDDVLEDIADMLLEEIVK